MSGQWFFAMVNIFLSIIPAVIYLVAAWLINGGTDVTAGTIVAFTTVQARLMFPLLGLALKEPREVMLQVFGPEVFTPGGEPSSQTPALTGLVVAAGTVPPAHVN